MVGSKWQQHYRCPRCDGKILSNVFPRNPVDDVITVLLVLLSAFGGPIAHKGPYFLEYIGAMLVFALFLSYREYRLYVQRREWRRWLPGC